MPEFNIENRLSSFEEAIKKNIELSTRSIDLSTQLLTEVKRTNDAFITHVDYIRKDLTTMENNIKDLSGRVKETEVELFRVGMLESEVRDVRKKVNEMGNDNFESKANKWIQSNFGKWLIGTVAVAMGAVLGGLIHTFFIT